MTLPTCKAANLVLMWLSIVLIMWPTFVLTCTIVGALFSDAELINRFNDQPKRLLLASFIEGFIQTLPYVAALASVMVVIIALLWKRLKLLFLIVALVAVLMVVLVFMFIPINLLNSLILSLLMMCFALVAGIFIYSFCRCARHA
jgi:hypothetical protein